VVRSIRASLIRTENGRSFLQSLQESWELRNLFAPRVVKASELCRILAFMTLVKMIVMVSVST
jgi:hypothetical protein